MVMIKPLPNMDLSKVNSKFGPRIHPITGKRSMHYGIDYPCALGTPVYAFSSGKVVVSKMQAGGGGLGNYVTILHTDGTYSLYAHLNIRHAYQGNIVKAGQIIGLSGNSGASTGPHLHFGLCKKYCAATVNNSAWFDPLPILKTLEEEMVEDKDVIINGKVEKCKMITKQEDGGDVNFIKLRDLEKLGLTVSFNKVHKCPEIKTK